MAETTNNFTGGRMNKDIDDRLLPENEYRNAINLQISKTENSDVGALQTILGNELVVNFNTLTGSTDLDCIGYFVDTSNNRVFLFLTNYTSPPTPPYYSPTADNYIYVYNVLQNTYIKLVEGAFLNFSKNSPIIGVNLLEDLLFWTDNRNQPRKINVNNALSSSTYYTIEDQISVAKLSPVYAPELFKSSALAIADTATVGTVSGSGPYTAEITPSPTFPPGLIAIGDIVYATPGSSDFTSGTVTAINIVGLDVVSFTISSITIFTSGTISLLYVNRDETTMYDVSSEFLPPYGSTAIVNGAITTTNIFVIDDPGTGFTPQIGQLVSGTGIPNGVRVIDYIPGAFTVEVSSNITLADNQEIKFNANPYYNPDFIGDPTYLENKFVRFSYRFRFDDNEYSIFAPFTQIAFIPKQDGYFLYEPPVDITSEPVVDNETAAFRSTIVSFMYNKANDIYLQIKLPCPGNMLESVCKISELDILYKESDGLAVQVVDIIPVSQIATQAGSSDIYVYNYQSKKPFKTLPERDLIRVYDKTPVKAFGQEIVSNRVVYSNYQDKQGYPKFLNYNVACNNKAPFNTTNNYTSIIEYPNHSVKQNRNYEVGVILSDKFGRQSGVILSNAVLPSTSGSVSYGAASLYVPYIEEESPGSNIPENGQIINQWPGYSLKVLFNEVISGNGITDWPGIYNGEASDPNYNPLGWYSYKIVVKQNEQDYYNVYLPGIMAAYPVEYNKELDKTSHFVLIGDNINKVPRDLNDVSNTQEQYRSSVKLYARVNNLYIDTVGQENFLNQQFYPGNTFSFVNTIATLNSLFPASSPTATPVLAEYYQFYQNISNPLIARLSTVTRIGRNTDGLPDPLTAGFLPLARLAVMETEPVDSRLDLYWETATSGIIEELNIAIIEGTDAPYSLEGWLFDLPESSVIGHKAVDGFYFADVLGVPMPVPIGNITMQVLNELGTDVTSRFSIQIGIDANTFDLVTNSYFYYGYDSDDVDSYTFYITVTTPDLPNPPIVSPFEKSGSLDNVAPTITVAPTGPQYYPLGETFIWQFEGENGTADPSQDQLDLTWSIESGGAGFYIDPVTGELTQPSGDIVEGIYDMVIKLTDAGGLSDTVAISIRFSALYGITWEVFEGRGGPGIVSTGSEPSGSFGAEGRITVEAGFTARVRAGAYPFPWGPNDVYTEVYVYGLTPVLIAAAYDGAGGGLSIAYHDLVGPGVWDFEVRVSYLGTGGGQGGMYLESV